MRTIGTMALWGVMTMGGALLLFNLLGASNGDEGKSAIEKAKDALLTEPARWISFNGGEVAVCFHRPEGGETVNIRIVAKNPTDKELTLSIPLQITRTDSSQFSRKESVPEVIDSRTISMTLPAHETKTVEITNIKKTTTDKMTDSVFSASIAQQGDVKVPLELSTFTVRAVLEEANPSVVNK